METLKYSCQDCGCTLWSDYSKRLGVCPECKDPDEETKDLESMLDSILNQSE